MSVIFFLFFFNNTVTTEIYTLSLHDALPISNAGSGVWSWEMALPVTALRSVPERAGPSRSEEPRLNSSHSQISYAVFCLKKKKKNKYQQYLIDSHFTSSQSISAYTFSF